MKTNTITGIKQRLVHAEKLEDIATSFFEWFEQSGDLPREARSCWPESVRALAAGSLRKALGLGQRIEHEAWFQHSADKFIHGALVVDGRMGVVLYFEDLGMGFIIVSALGGRTDYLRFRAIVPPQDPSVN